MAELTVVHLCYSQFACNICGLITNISLPNQYISIINIFILRLLDFHRDVDRISMEMPILYFMGS